MPMRGTLPLVNYSMQNYREVTSLEKAIGMFVSSSDFAAVSAFAAAGIFASLYFALTYPTTFVVALLAMQSP